MFLKKIFVLRPVGISQEKLRFRSTAVEQDKKNAAKPDPGVKVEKVRSFDEIPEVKGLPFIGPLMDYMPWNGFERTRLDRHWTERHDKYGEIFKEKLPGKEMIVFCRTPEDTEAMFRADGRTPNRPFLPALRRLKQGANLPESILTLNGDEWYKYRRIANSTLMVNKMIWKYTEQQKKVGKDFVKYINRHIGENGEVTNFAGALNKWAFEVSGIFLFSKRLGLLGENVENDAVELANNLGIQLEFFANSLFGLNMWRYFKTKEIKKVDAALDSMIKIMEKIIAREKGNTDNKDSILYKIMNEEELTEKEKISMLYDILGASGESTSQAAAFMLYGLTLKPEVQEKLRNEVIRLAKDDTTSGRAVGNLEYVNAFLKETYRLFPLSLVYSRFYNKNIVLSGYNIPAGVRILNTSTATSARNPKYFPNPDELIPERWMDKKIPINKFAVVGSFGQGPRACVGRRMAMQELRLLLIEILKEYRVEYHHKPIVSMYRSVAQPSEPPQFKFVPINK